jgi:hypothetical protein
MTDDRVGAIEALLTRTEEAHGAYEMAELNGVYDEDWARWYAAYAVDHGLGGLVGHDVNADRLGTFLSEAFAAFEREDPKPAAPWAAYIAERIASEL